MKSILLLFAAAVLLSGCTTLWTQPGKTEADFKKDREACELAVRKDLALKGLSDT